MRGESNREAVCAAYECLLIRALGRYAPDAELRDITRNFGVRGGVVGGGWDGATVAASLEARADIALERPLRLDCACEPRACHARSLARRVRGALASAWDWSPAPSESGERAGRPHEWDL